MGIMVYSLLWVMQDFVHQPYLCQRTVSELASQLRQQGLQTVDANRHGGEVVGPI